MSSALRAFLPGGDDCAPHDERRLARCLVVDPCDGGRSSLLLQFAFNPTTSNEPDVSVHHGTGCTVARGGQVGLDGPSP